jgi:aminoglycoside phosphotransferase (APT) family kinase protein
MNDADVKALVPAALGTVLTVSSLAPGLSGASVCAVTTERGDFVLRVQSAGVAPELWADSVRIQRLASELGVAPGLRHVSDPARVTIHDRIAGPPFPQALADPATRRVALTSLMEQLAKLHGASLAGLEQRPPLDAVALATGLWRSQCARGDRLAWVLPLGAHLETARVALAGDSRQVMSHGDLNPSNIVWDGRRVWLVDWDTAAPAHPYLDWAGLAAFLDPSDDEALALLALQERVELAPADARRFAALREVTRIAYGCMFLSRCPSLAGLGIDQREATPTLGEFYARLRTGQVVLGSPTGQALFGAAILRRCAVPQPA